MNEVAQELEALLGLADRLRGIHEGAAAQRPATGAWSPKETLGHLVDSAANNHQRFVRLQLGNHLELPFYEQDGWVRVQDYQNLEWRDLIELWRIYNRHLAHLIRHVDPGCLKHSWRMPDGNLADLEFIMSDYVVHMKHHLDEILGQSE